jgi:hypothetical protein
MPGQRSSGTTRPARLRSAKSCQSRPSRRQVRLRICSCRSDLLEEEVTLNFLSGPALTRGPYYFMQIFRVDEATFLAGAPLQRCPAFCLLGDFFFRLTNRPGYGLIRKPERDVRPRNVMRQRDNAPLGPRINCPDIDTEVFGESVSANSLTHLLRSVGVHWLVHTNARRSQQITKDQGWVWRVQKFRFLGSLLHQGAAQSVAAFACVCLVCPRTRGTYRHQEAS